MLAGTLLYLFDAPYAPAKEFILSGMQWLARCAFAMLNRIERSERATLTADLVQRLLELLHVKIHQSRRDVLAPAFLAGDATKKPLLFLVEVSAMPAPKDHPLAGRAMLPVLLGFCAPTNRKELTSYRAARFYDSPSLQGWLTALLLHVGAAPPDNQDDLDVVRAMLGGPGGPTGGCTPTSASTMTTVVPTPSCARRAGVLPPRTSPAARVPGTPRASSSSSTSTRTRRASSSSRRPSGAACAATSRKWLPSAPTPPTSRASACVCADLCWQT